MVRGKRGRTSSRKRKTKKRFNYQEWLFRFTIFCLSLVIIAFMYSFFQRQRINPTRVEVARAPDDITTLITKIKNDKRYLNVEVEVLNGCGISGLAQEFTNFLRKEGFDVVDFTNADNFNYKKTIVIQRKDDAKEKAISVCKALKIDPATIKKNLNNPTGIDVTVIIGSDYKEMEIYRTIKNMGVY